jgi:hypothetical protein
LRAASAKARDAKAAGRMLAIALVLEGKDRKTAAETCGMDRQTLRDWLTLDHAAADLKTPDNITLLPLRPRDPRIFWALTFICGKSRRGSF